MPCQIFCVNDDSFIKTEILLNEVVSTDRKKNDILQNRQKAGTTKYNECDNYLYLTCLLSVTKEWNVNGNRHKVKRSTRQLLCKVV